MSRSWRAVMALVTTGGLLASGGGVAQAAFPGSDGAVVFTRGDHVWRGHWDASGEYRERPLTTSGVNRNPAWSPSGQRIAFNTKSGAIVTMSPTGTDRKTLVPAGGYQPAWSPAMASGSKIAFVRVPAGGVGDIWTVPVAGGALKRLTTDGAAACGNYSPSWSPDGKRLAYMRLGKAANGSCQGGASTLVVMTLATGARATVKSVVSSDTGEALTVGGRTQFDVNGTVVFDTSDATCSNSWGWYNPSTKQSGSYDYFKCEWEPSTSEIAPTPSGGMARVSYVPDFEVGHECLSLSSVQRTCVPASSVNRGWGRIDVQPRP